MQLKQNIFTQPEGYKEELKQKVFSQLKQPRRNGLSYMKWTVAATVVLLLAFAVWQFNKSNETIDEEVVYAYLEENIEDIDEDILYSMVDVKADTAQVTIDDIFFDDEYDENDIY